MTDTTSTTSWWRIVTAVLAGCAVAFQLGKIPAALPSLIEAMQLNLFWAGAIVSMFSVMVGGVGLLVGSLADRVGHLRCALTGLGVCGLASCIGASAGGLPLLLASRVFEGLGFILAVVSLPPMITAASTPADRPAALAFWSTFLPAGMSAMMLASPWIMARVGWRGLWICTALLILCWCPIIYFAFRHRATSLAAKTVVTRSWSTLTRAAPLLLAGCFAAYSAQFLAVTSFLPTLLIDLHGVSVSRAATLGALVVAANVIGNIGSGWLLRSGVNRHALLAAALAIAALCTVGVFSELFSVVGRVACAFLFSAIGGLVPGTLFASVPEHTQQPSQTAALVGLLLQGAGIGQIIGPLLLTSTVKTMGAWSYAPLFTLAASFLGIVCVLGLRQLRDSRSRAQV